VVAKHRDPAHVLCRAEPDGLFPRARCVFIQQHKSGMPRIELYAIFSCERENMPETLSLCGEFFSGGGCDLDATVHLLHFDEGKTDIINQYIMFCRVFNDQIKKYGYSPQAIRETLRICRDEGILAEYIKKMEGEIMDIMTYMFDEENNKRLFGLEQQRIGEQREKKQTAINLLNMNLDISIIEKATGLSKKEILELQKSK
jgi:hypothetical protein